MVETRELENGLLAWAFIFHLTKTAMQSKRHAFKSLQIFALRLLKDHESFKVERS